MIIQETRYDGYKIQLIDSVEGYFCYIFDGDLVVDDTDFYRFAHNPMTEAKRMIDLYNE